jgi:SNF2 family DNA or RNA helicase
MEYIATINIPIYEFMIGEPLEMKMVDNHSIVFSNGKGKQRSLDPYCPIVPIIACLLKSINAVHYSYKLISKRCTVELKIYVSTVFIRNLCDNFYVAPKLLDYIINEKCVRPYLNLLIPISPLIKEMVHFQLPKLLIEPYTHQINNINWMISTERNVDLGLCNLQCIDKSNLSYYNNFFLDNVSKVLYDDQSIWNDKGKVKNLIFKGGVLCDEVGLGKTFSATALIMSDITSKKPKVTTIKSKIKLKLKPKSETEPKSEPEPRSEPEPEPETEPRSKSELKPHKKRLQSTLVVCPRRLVGQWKTEIQKYTKSLSILEISTMSHIKKYCYSDNPTLNNANVVVTSFSMFSNKKYIAYEKEKLCDFKWNRLIIDEGHETLLSDLKKMGPIAVRDSILHLSSKYKWVITGTPLASEHESLKGILNFLVDNKYIVDLPNLSEPELSRVFKMLFKRHNKESVKTEVFIPRVNIEVMLLDFSVTEKEIYNNCYDPERKLKLCTNIMISEEDNEILGGKPMNLNQVNSAMAHHHKNKVKIQKTLIVDTYKSIDRINDDLNDTENDILSSNDPNVIQELKAEIRRFKRIIKTREENIDKYKSLVSFHETKATLYTSFNIEEMLDKYCPITAVKFRDCEKLAITSTGRFYSDEGIRLLFTNKKTIRCPATRELLTMSNIKFVKPNISNDIKSVSEIDMLISRWGTKMAYMVDKLNKIFTENLSHQVIIFSQWKKMLNLVSMVLNESNIKHVFCRGNVHMMSKSIEKFKTDPTFKVILLSSESCSSGSNLTEASHIFLLDSMNADRNNAKAIEEQAIARSVRLGQKNNVLVTKFIMRNTIEEEFHKRIR